MKLKHWILNSKGEPEEASSFEAWGKWFEKSKLRQLDQTEIGGVSVSTVFLGLDHNFSGRGAPILWETLVFGGKHDQEMWRYSSKKDALSGHAAAVKLVRADIKNRRSIK